MDRGVVQFAPGVTWRISKRGLVLAAPDGETMLLEHPRAAELPRLVGQAQSSKELIRRLGQPNAERLVDELVEVGVLTDEQASQKPNGSVPPQRRFTLTRSGLEVAGIDRAAAWFDGAIMPLVLTWPARILLGLFLLAGGVAVAQGEPPGPQVTARPIIDALLGFTLALVLAAAHEFAHAVALTHFGRRPRRAGFGFYWGTVSFYVDSSEALTLPRRQRVIQALAGLGVDVVTVAALAIVAQVSTSVLISAVAWRLAVLGLLDIGLNLAPVLQLDGHWALADYLDEPDLAPRARRALSDVLRRRRRGDTPRWLAVYGATSLAGGIALLGVAALVFWAAAGDLIRALFSGNPAEVVVGVLVVAPFAASLLLSTVGLLLEVAMNDEAPQGAIADGGKR